MAEEDRNCAHCPRTRAEHALDDCHHLYNEEGQLIPKPPTPKARPASAVIPIESGVAMRLGMVLRDKKLITQGELDYILGGPSGSEPTGAADGAADRSDSRDRATAGTG